MQRIIFPTDFSKNSFIALSYAQNLAKALNSELYIIHAYDFIQKTGHLKSIESIVRDEAEQEMSRLVARLRKESDDLKITGHVLRGKPSDSINRVATEQGADIVLMGTQGATGALEVFIGSTANAVIRKSDTATLVIPTSVSYEKPEKIILAIDQDDYDPASLKPLLSLVSNFSGHLYLLHVDEAATSDAYPQALANQLDSVTFSYHYRQGSDLSAAINLFGEEIDADLITMVRRKKNLFQKLFTGSNTKKELFETQLPLLILME